MGGKGRTAQTGHPLYGLHSWHVVWALIGLFFFSVIRLTYLITGFNLKN